MTEELLFICNHAKECRDVKTCTHGRPHVFENDPTGGCLYPLCRSYTNTVCKPVNLNKKTEKQFAKYTTKRLLK